MLKLPTHSGFHDLFLKYICILFVDDTIPMSESSDDLQYLRGS